MLLFLVVIILILRVFIAIFVVDFVLILILFIIDATFDFTILRLIEKVHVILNLIIMTRKNKIFSLALFIAERRFFCIVIHISFFTIFI